jgi:O-antigen/teichoic acid export membrane protein
LKKPAKNILYLFLGDISTRLVGFFVVTYLANTLGSSGFGKINISLAILSYAILFGGSGLPILGTREISLNEKNKEIFIGNLISARFISSIVIFIIFFLLSETLYNDDISTLNFIYLFFLFPYSLILDWFFQAKKRMDIIAFSRFTGMMVYLILIFSFVKK